MKDCVRITSYNVCYTKLLRIARILKELTARLSPSSESLADSLSRMVFLDGIGAAARWGRDWRCVFAEDIPHQDLGAGESADSGEESVSRLRLRQARHPLLGSRAVPIDLVLTPGGRVLIITGPNTGGKTVSLKTVALFALLNQSGWPVPAAETTALPIFDFIGCDIGDEQSLDQSLSTFSGHMKNVAGILASATEKSLVLLDELASGTDPQEGSAIAMAVLDSLLERGSVVLATTHHGVLKNYGYTHPSCVNASVDFDENTLSPTYRILMGVPGESHALDIAKRNGLDPAVVAAARGYLASERADVSALIKGLTAKHEELARFEKDKRAEERDLREKRRKTDLRELQLRQKEVELREQGYRRLDRLFDESRKQLENLVREIREGELTREKTLRITSYNVCYTKLLRGYRGRLITDAEMRGLHAYNAHDYRAESLAEFFEAARLSGFPLGTEELELRAILLAEGIIALRDSSYVPGAGAVVSISRQSAAYLRYLFLAHESYHGIYFTDPGFRAEVADVFAATDKRAVDYLKDYFTVVDTLGYDVSDPYLLENEYMAYLLQQPQARVAPYFTDNVDERFLRSYNFV